MAGAPKTPANKVRWEASVRGDGAVYYGVGEWGGQRAVKIGWTGQAPNVRAGQLKIRLLACHAGTPQDEMAAHARFGADRLYHEWYYPSLRLLAHIDEIGIAVDPDVKRIPCQRGPELVLPLDDMEIAPLDDPAELARWETPATTTTAQERGAAMSGDLLDTAVNEVRKTYEALCKAQRQCAEADANVNAAETRYRQLRSQLETQEQRLVWIARGQIDSALDISLNTSTLHD